MKVNQHGIRHLLCIQGFIYLTSTKDTLLASSFIFIAGFGFHDWNCLIPWLCFYQTRSAWSMDQGSNKNHSPVNNFTPTVTKFCVMWEGQALPHDTKFHNCGGRPPLELTHCGAVMRHHGSWSTLVQVTAICLMAPSHCLNHCWLVFI